MGFGGGGDFTNSMQNYNQKTSTDTKQITGKTSWISLEFIIKGTNIHRHLIYKTFNKYLFYDSTDLFNSQYLMPTH